jgi:hypothetical protein
MKPLLIFFAFALAAIPGTLEHELGHYIAARAQGFDAEIHYGFTTVRNYRELIEIAELNGTTIELSKKFNYNTLGGPIMTMLTGTVGILVLLMLRRRNTIDAYNPLHLFWIIVALCWSREIYTASFGLYDHIMRNTCGSDETWLVAYYHISPWLAFITLFMVSFAICAWVCFGLVQRHRWPLFFYGIAGSLAGAALWFGWLGRVLLP